MLAITLPCIVFFFYWNYLPESPRWLLLQGRFDEAQEIIERAARINGKSELKIKLDQEEIPPKPSRLREFKLLISSWYLLRSTLIIWASWMCLSGAYYGNGFFITKLNDNQQWQSSILLNDQPTYSLSLNAKHMSGNIYMNYLYISIVEMPGKQ